jgi:quinol monooxygenase YgiN
MEVVQEEEEAARAEEGMLSFPLTRLKEYEKCCMFVRKEMMLRVG